MNSVSTVRRACASGSGCSVSEKDGNWSRGVQRGDHNLSLHDKDAVKVSPVCNSQPTLDVKWRTWFAVGLIQEKSLWGLNGAVGNYYTSLGLNLWAFERSQVWDQTCEHWSKLVTFQYKLVTFRPNLWPFERSQVWTKRSQVWTERSQVWTNIHKFDPKLVTFRKVTSLAQTCELNFCKGHKFGPKFVNFHNNSQVSPRMQDAKTRTFLIVDRCGIKWSGWCSQAQINQTLFLGCDQYG